MAKCFELFAKGNTVLEVVVITGYPLRYVCHCHHCFVRGVFV